MVMKQGERRKIEQTVARAAADARRQLVFGNAVREATVEASLALKADAADLAALDTRVGALETADTAIDGRLDALEAEDTAIDVRLDALEAADTALDGRLDTIEAALPGKLQWATVPASAGATGTAGQIAYESGFLYVCVASNTWQRVAIATWP